MEIIDAKELAIPAVKVIRFKRFKDERGFFTETYRSSEFKIQNGLECLGEHAFVQANESFSRANVLRGMHFQWNPYMGKLVRTIQGRMVDLVLDIRLGSPTIGKIIAYEMPSNQDREWDEWIWVPPGFAHGNYFSEPTHIEYLCSGMYNSDCEAGISPLAGDLDWSLCREDLSNEFQNLVATNVIISQKDSEAPSLGQWLASKNSHNFHFDH